MSYSSRQVNEGAGAGEIYRASCQALEDSIEDYFEFCEELGQKPEKPYSGKFVVRVDPELHRKLSERALQEDISLNQLVNETLASAFD